MLITGKLNELLGYIEKMLIILDGHSENTLPWS